MFNFSVLLELLTQKRAVENNVTLYDKLYKEGVFSDVKNLIGSAQKVTIKIFCASWQYVYFKLEHEVSS